MNETKVVISLFTSGDSSPVISALDQIGLPDYSFEYKFPSSFTVNTDEIIIIQDDNYDSEIYKQLFAHKEEIPNKILFIIKENDALLASSIIKAGFQDIFVFPFEYFKMVSFLQEIILSNSFRTGRKITEGINYALDISTIIGNSKQMIRIIELTKKIADKKDINVLILGETGTGKGLLAKEIHKYAFGDNAPFVDITCTAIPEALLESELFGYEPGAFTNAKNQKQGLFELAEHGTLFLDEIGDLSPGIQAKLLRTIEKKIIRRLGGVTDIPISARIISATNRNLDLLIENNTFRRDLYHRLNNVTLELPPLRERGNDIIILANHFIEYFNSMFDKNVNKIAPDLKEFFLSYSWPGNIREFRNSFERAVLLSDENTLRLKHFSQLYARPAGPKFSNDDILPQFIKLKVEFEKVDLREISRLYAVETLNKMNGNKSKTAKLLGVSRPKLDQLLNK
jgi:two-component system response regulator AtoC